MNDGYWLRGRISSSAGSSDSSTMLRRADCSRGGEVGVGGRQLDGPLQVADLQVRLALEVGEAAAAAASCWPTVKTGMTGSSARTMRGQRQARRRLDSTRDCSTPIVLGSISPSTIIDQQRADGEADDLAALALRPASSSSTRAPTTKKPKLNTQVPEQNGRQQAVGPAGAARWRCAGRRCRARRRAAVVGLQREQRRLGARAERRGGDQHAPWRRSRCRILASTALETRSGHSADFAAVT